MTERADEDAGVQGGGRQGAEHAAGGGFAESDGPEAPRRARLFAAASARGVPLRTILVVDAVVIVTWVCYRVLGRLREVILWILVAAFIALVLNPAVVALQRRKLRRGSAVGIVFLVAVLAVIGLLVLFGYPLVNGITHFAERLPSMTHDLEKGHGQLADLLQRVHLLSWVQENAPKLQTAAKNLGKPALSLGTNLGKAVFSTILALTTIAFLSLFMLIEAPNIRRGVLSTLAPRRRAKIEEVSATVSRSVTAYVLGTVAMSLLFGLVVFVTLVVLGVPFALLLGLWVGLVAMIPLVGGLIAGVPTVAVALLHSPLAAIVTLIVFVAFQLVENHFIYPVVMSRTVRMNPLWVLLAVLVGANLGGVFGSALGALTGALIAIPVGGAIQVVFREVWQQTRATDGPEVPVDGVLHGARLQAGPVETAASASSGAPDGSPGAVRGGPAGGKDRSGTRGTGGDGRGPAGGPDTDPGRAPDAGAPVP